MRRCRFVLSVCSASAAAALLAACTPPQTTPAAMHRSPVPLRLAQIGYGQDARFEQCREDVCPQRTPKTLPSSASAPITQASTPPDTHSADTVAHSAAAQPEIVPVEVPSPKASPAEQLIDIQFPSASARLNTQTPTDWRWIALQLAHARQVRVVGYTGATGQAQANERLAKARADTVLSELIAIAPGIAPITTVNTQDAGPDAVSGGGIAGRQRNPSVQIRYLLGSAAVP